MMLFQKLLLVLVAFASYGAAVTVGDGSSSKLYVPLESSLYSKDFIARWNEYNAGAVGDELQLSLVKNGNYSDGTKTLDRSTKNAELVTAFIKCMYV